MMPRLADTYDAFLLDLDGVLVREAQAIPGAADTVARLREAGKGIAFVTNNSARTPQVVAQRLLAAGIEARPEEVETSGLVAAELLAARGVASAFVVGEDGIRRALAEHGIEIRDGEPEAVDVVVVGWDRSADYAKLRTASLLVQHGAGLVATNGDASFPALEGNWPGAGALLAVVETTTGVRAEVVGKPHAPILRAALRRAGGGVPLVVGDRLDTDIAGAAALGWDSLLVLTGVTTREDLDASETPPTFVGDDVTALLRQDLPVC